MTNYTKTTNFATKDTLPSGNANKIVKGTEIDTEFNNIATAVATKADTAGPTFTGTVTIPTVDLNGGAIDGTTVGASTAAAITGTTIVANTSINIAGDGATVTGIKDEDDMSSNSATKLATQQSIKAYVDSQITAQDLDFQADSGGALSIDLDSETLTFTGGTGVDTSGSGNAVTFAIDSTVATLTGTQTLTNKTLTSPTLNTPTIGTSFTIGSATITEAELEILDGATVTTAELNVLDGITSTTAELNILDGVTSTAAELNILDGVTATAAELNILDGVTSTAAELNILDGVTSTTAELNILDGVTATTAELNYVDGVTSAIQTQIDAKAPLASPTFTGTVNAAALTVDTTTLVVDATNNRVGIGTNSPTSRLQLDGAEDRTGGLTLSAGGQNHTYFLSSDFVNVHNIETSSGSAAHTWQINGSERLRIDADGDVGIGSTNADAKLKVELNPSGTVLAGLRIGYNSTSANYFDGDTQFFRNGAGTSERMRIDSSGRVNIGGYANSQGYELEVVNDTNANTLLLHREEVSVGVVSTLGFQGTQANDQSARFAEISSEFDASWGGDLVFSTKPANGTPNNTVSERMRIDSSGNLLVGTTAANFSISSEVMDGFGVSGSGKFVTIGVNNNYCLALQRNGSDGVIQYFFNDTASAGNISVSGSTVTYNTSSDQRLKENIVEAPSSSDDIDAIQVRSFDWKADGRHQKYGMVAQELNTVAPDAVTIPEDPEEMMGVDYSKLVPMLVKEIQSLRARVAQLENN